MRRLRHYILVFDHQREELVGCTEFRDAAPAIEAYQQTERAHEGNARMEIVLIGAYSLETVKRTHANYFKSAAASKYLQGL